MPTYEYICKLCEHEFETFQSIKSDPLVECPSCGKNGLQRRIGMGAGILFKGSGFYQTDYRKSGKEAAAAEKQPDSPKPDSTKNGSETPAKSPVAPAADKGTNTGS